MKSTIRPALTRACSRLLAKIDSADGAERERRYRSSAVGRVRAQYWQWAGVHAGVEALVFNANGLGATLVESPVLLPHAYDTSTTCFTAWKKKCSKTAPIVMQSTAAPIRAQGQLQFCYF
jgi:hypothetical protein